MSYWCDDRKLDLEQRRLDAEQDRAKRRLAAEQAKTTPNTKDQDHV